MKKTHRFPFIHPWPFIRRPKLGERYQRKHLQPLARKMVERVAELTGILAKELLPWRDKFYLGNAIGQYVEGFHSIATRHPLSLTVVIDAMHKLHRGVKSNLTQHEQIHAIIGIICEKNPKYEEFYANAGVTKLYAGTIGPEYYNAGRIESEMYQGEINKFYKAFGVDGLLTLIVSDTPPWKINSFGKQLVEQKLLSQNGFTEEGKKWFLGKVKPEIIRKKLAEIKTFRQTQGLRVN